MPSLEDHPSSSFVKLLYIGDSGTGKTGSLVSLLADGYKFRILDMDNGLGTLKFYAKKQCPEALANVEYETRRDEYKATRAGPVIKGQPKAFFESLEILQAWSELEDPNTIFVLDSISAWGKSAFEWAKGLNPGAKDPRQWYFAAQQAIENGIAMIAGPGFNMNVILISHVNYKEVTEGVSKGYVNAVGSALGPIIARYFDTLVLAESSGVGKNTRRRIKTLPTGVIDLKVANPEVDAELPLESGLSTIFKTFKGTN